MGMTAVIGALSLLLIAVLMTVMRRKVLAGTFKLNGIWGIRTSATMTSQAAWDAGHRAALPGMQITAFVAYAAAVMLALMGWSVRGDGEAAEPMLASLLLLSLAVVVGVLLWTARVANRAAKAVGS